MIGLCSSRPSSLLMAALALLAMGWPGAGLAQTAADRARNLLGGSGISQDEMRNERRVALIIGNSNYTYASPLLNPRNDAEAMTTALQEVGFEVMSVFDGTLAEMRSAIIGFGRELGAGSVGLFFYAGHAIQFDGENYLIPIDANAEDEEYATVVSVNVDEILGRMEDADNRLNIVVLDACRDNPFASSTRSAVRGLAQTAAPSGTFIAYAAAPGQRASDGTGDNSPFTSALLTALDQPGLKLEEVFKQVRGDVVATTDQTPWTNSSITGDFYFRMPEEEPPAPEPLGPAPGTAIPAPTARSEGAASSTERLVWNEVKDSNNPAELQFFIATFPDSIYTPLAKLRLASLQSFQGGNPAPAGNPEIAAAPANEAPAEPAPDRSQGAESLAALPRADSSPPATAGVPGLSPEALERELGLSREDRRLVQLALNDLGQDAGAPDGQFGSQTRWALAEWQLREGLPDTGYLGPEQVAFLLEHGRSVRARIEGQPGRGGVEPTVGVFAGPATGSRLKDCGTCPEMVVVPAGTFAMGSASAAAHSSERPQHQVTFAAPFAVGVFEITFNEWEACVAAGGCGGMSPDDEGWGRGRRPVIKVSWDDANAYVAWLRETTGEPYRLLSEAEWEYACRGGTSTAYAFGDEITSTDANFGSQVGSTTEVGTYPPNPWGLADCHGNVFEWVEDPWHDTFAGAPSDGSAWQEGGPGRVIRGGSWFHPADYVRSALRIEVEPDTRNDLIGFRVAKSLGN